MNNVLIEVIKNTFGENKLFSFDEIPNGKASSKFHQSDIKDLVSSGLIKRHSYGLYYLPGKRLSNEPSVADAVERAFIHDSKKVFGFYGDNSYLFVLLKKIPSNEIVVYSNKATSGKKNIFRFGQRITVKKPYYHVTGENATLNGFLTYLTTSPFATVERDYSLLANYIRLEHFAAQDVLDLLPSFPSKTADKLLKSGLYKCLWKH